MSIYSYSAIGSIIGFLLFIVLLESDGMGCILYRTNSKFRFNGLLKYIKSPFNQRFLWYPELWKHNWIVMSICGGLTGFSIYNLST